MDSGHEIYLSRAIGLATENVRGRRGGPFGAVVVLEGAVIGSGTNLVTSLNDPTAHAEILAIREACGVVGSFRLDGAYLYCSCEPCPMCLGAIYWARLEGAFFAADRTLAAAAGFDDHAIYREFGLEPVKRRIPVRSLPVQGADEPFRLWLADEGHRDY